MPPAQLFTDDAHTLLADEVPGTPPQLVRRRAILKVTLASIAVLVAVAGFSVLGRQPSQGLVDGDLALYGQHFCAACNGHECNCDWANYNSCHARAADSTCCWSCCCAQDGFYQDHHFHSMLSYAPGMIAAPEFASGEMDTGCSLSAYQVVHVTGNSGTTYHAQVMGYTGHGMYLVGIGGNEYSLNMARIAECAPLSTFLYFWLPLLLAIVVLCIIAFCIYKKIKTGKLPEPELPKSSSSRTCCGTS